MHRHRLPVPFLIAVACGVGALTAASAPSPLYPVYQRLWGFTSLTLTLVFAVYVFALITALLVVGSLSDIVGRRPVASAALAVLAVGMLVFATASGTPDLISARIIQGFAVGAATGTTTAMIAETAPNARSGAVLNSAASPLGITLGAVLSGVLVQYAPMPRQLVFWVLGVLFVLLAALVWSVPESKPPRRPISAAVLLRSLIPSVGLPESVRPVFGALVPSMIATWALAGLYLSLGASVVRDLFGVQNHFAASVVLAFFFAAGIAGSATLAALPEPIGRHVGYGALALGVLLTIPAALLAKLPLYVVGSVVAGAGFGAIFRSVVSTIGAAAPTSQRGRSFATMYVTSYAAFSIPALVAGVAVELVGIRTTFVAYGALEVVLVIAAFWASIRGDRATTKQQRPDREDPHA